VSTGITHWRIPPAAWVPIGLAVVAEATSNALRAYGLGTHLEAFTTTVAGYTVSVAGVVLVLAACAISLSQARAAWVAMMASEKATADRWLADSNPAAVGLDHRDGLDHP
jgi:hypothetical protein